MQQHHRPSLPQDKVEYLVLPLNSPGMVPAFLVPYRIKRTSGSPSEPSSIQVVKKVKTKNKQTPPNQTKSKKQNKPKQTNQPHKQTGGGGGGRGDLRLEEARGYYCKVQCTATYQTEHFLYLGFLRAVFLVTLWTLPAIWQFLVK